MGGVVEIEPAAARYFWALLYLKPSFRRILWIVAKESEARSLVCAATRLDFCGLDAEVFRPRLWRERPRAQWPILLVFGLVEVLDGFAIGGFVTGSLSHPRVIRIDIDTPCHLGGPCRFCLSKARSGSVAV